MTRTLKVILAAGLCLAAFVGIDQAFGGSTSNYILKVARVKSSAPTYVDGNAAEETISTSGGLYVAGRGTAGSADSNVMTVQGIASGTEVIIKGSGTAGSANAGVVTVQGAGTTGTPLTVAVAEKSDELHCFLASSTATTSTQITGCEVQTGKSIYITSMSISGDAANATATPAIIQSGTSTACTGPHVLYQCWHAATGHCEVTFPTPLKVTASEGLCVLDGTTGSKTAMISGFVK